MRQHFSEKQIVELTVFCGMWNYSNRLCEALHVDLERPDKRIEFQEKGNTDRYDVQLVLPALVAGIHVLHREPNSKTWVAGTSPAMTSRQRRS